MRAALLVIDLQRWYLERGHPEKLARVGTLLEKTNDLIDFFHEKTLPVFKVRNVHKKDGSTWNQFMRPYWTGKLLEGTVTEGTWEADQHPEVHARDADVVLTKTRSSAFVRTELEDLLRERQVDTVVLAGFAINRCVRLTAIDAWERDFRVILSRESVIGTNVADGDLMWDYLHKAFQVEPVSNAEVKRIVTTHIETG